jgi:hypothetical protein
MSDRACRRKGNTAYKSTEESRRNDAYHGVATSDGVKRTLSAACAMQGWLEERTPHKELNSERVAYAAAKEKLK